MGSTCEFQYTTNRPSDIQQALGNVYARRGGRGMWATKVKSTRFDQQDGAIVS